MDNVKTKQNEYMRGEPLLMCAVILQYSVPCLSLNYMKADKIVSDSTVTILRTIIIICC